MFALNKSQKDMLLRYGATSLALLPSFAHLPQHAGLGLLCAGAPEVRLRPSDRGLQLLKQLSGSQAAALPSSKCQQNSPPDEPAGSLAAAAPPEPSEPTALPAETGGQPDSSNDPKGSIFWKAADHL